MFGTKGVIKPPAMDGGAYPDPPAMPEGWSFGFAKTPTRQSGMDAGLPRAPDLTPLLP
jgi:hypothetical protein